MHYLITKSEINSLITLNSTFPDLLHAWLTINSTCDEQYWWENWQLIERFSFLYYGKQNSKCLVFHCSPLTFSCHLFFVYMWLNSIYFCFNLSQMNDCSKNPGKLCYENNSNHGFDLIETMCDKWVVLCYLLDLALLLGCFCVNNVIKIYFWQ